MDKFQKLYEEIVNEEFYDDLGDPSSDKYIEIFKNATSKELDEIKKGSSVNTINILGDANGNYFAFRGDLKFDSPELLQKIPKSNYIKISINTEGKVESSSEIPEKLKMSLQKLNI